MALSAGGAAFAAVASSGGQHVVELGHFELGVADHRIVNFVALGLFDIRGPLAVIGDGIDAEAEDFTVALLEFRLKASHVAEFRRADGREVFGMREQDGPAVADPFVETDGALGGFGSEIGGSVVDAYGHDGSPINFPGVF